MTVAATTRKAGPYTGNGVTTSFPFSFKVFAASEMVVTQTTPAGVESTLTLTTHYTVSLNADQDANPGGSVVAVSAPATDYLITLTSNVAHSQGVTLSPGGGFYPRVISDALDRVTILAQQLAEKLSRAVVVPVSSSAVPADYLTDIQADADASAASAAAASASAGTATTKAGEASVSAAAALVSENAAAASAASVLGQFAASAGASLIGWIQAGTGAVARTLQAKARDVVSVLDFGAVGDGITDDTNALQYAINAAAAVSGTVIFEAGKTYLVATLTPKAHARLNLNGSTIKLKNSTNTPIFDGTGAAASKRNFCVENGILDGNQANNAGNVNGAGGGIWLSSWTDTVLRNVKFINCFQICINLSACIGGVIEDIEMSSCGVANAYGFYGYGIVLSSSTTRIAIRNVTVASMYGYGFHFYTATDITAENLKFDTLNYGTSSIAITWTQAARCRVSNVSCTSVSGDSLEFNASTDQVLENMIVTSAGRYALLMGDNSTGIFNERVKISGFKTVSTGGTYSLNINWIKRCHFEFFDLDKDIATSGSGSPGTDDRHNFFSDSVVAANISIYWTFYRKFELARIDFTNFYVKELAPGAVVATCPDNAGDKGLSLANAGVTYVDFNAFNATGTWGSFAGKLKVWSYYNNTQGTYHEVLFYGSSNNTTLNLSAVTTISNNVARAMTIAADAANRRISITNGSGVTVYVVWAIEFVSPL